eukprot:CAMPEP_0115228894 /NCGR_PEP_ID=MMETSP0270-20121206/31909_1 /TAXON_ID=71861 /ORGANISM="Scrippsiella trochoidea, Strain CCMP3099" /LENGTH=190 /DNA_ID=CAMNT_0002643417 /DNA_START=372 /DNA_END=945 /DNA_ORIENTATION=+
MYGPDVFKRRRYSTAFAAVCVQRTPACFQQALTLLLFGAAPTAAALGDVHCSGALRHEEIHEPLVEDPSDRREPEELQSRACDDSSEQEAPLQLGHRLRHGRRTMPPKQDCSVGVQDEAEEHEEHDEDDARSLDKESVGRATVAEEEHDVQERRRCLHGQEDGRIVRQHAIPADDQAGGDERHMVQDVVP